MGDGTKNLRPILKTVRGRGATTNETGRFNRLQTEYDLQDAGFFEADDLPTLKTEYYADHSKSIIATSDSPDLGFTKSLNPYRGCEHGCIYCYARPTHEYVGLSAGLDFESKIFVKQNAPELLRAELMKKSWSPDTIMMSGVTDCYQPIERKLQITRGCLEVLRAFKNPVAMITKNFLVTRDVDILAEMAAQHLASVTISLTTLDEQLGRVMEPRTSSPEQRLRAIEILSKAGVYVSVNVAPVIPGLTDHEIPKILEAAANAGAMSAGYVMLRLPHSVKDLFTDWLQANWPEKKDKVMAGIRDVRDGDLYDAKFGVRMRGSGIKAEHISNIFDLFKRKYFKNSCGYPLRKDLFVRPGTQLSFGE